MKITHFLISALYCALITLPIIAMQKDKLEETEPIVPASITQDATNLDRLALLRKYINLKSFFFELGALCSDDVFKSKKLLGLLKYVKIEKLPELFSLTSVEMEEYFNIDEIKTCIDLLMEEDDDNAEQRALALKHCFNGTAWQELLECQEAETVLACLVDLCCLAEKTSQEKLIEYGTAITGLIEQLDAGTESRLTTYLDLPALQSIINDLLKGTLVPRERIVQTILCNPSLKATGYKERVERVALIDRLLTLVAAVLRAGNTPPIESILACIKWDTIIEVVPQLFGFNKYVNNFFDIPRLKLVIQKLQNKQLITTEDLMYCVSIKVFEYIISLGQFQTHVVRDLIVALIDFDAIASLLNAYFVENKRDHRQLGDTTNKVFSRLEESLGIDLPNAFNRLIPERVQTTALMTVANGIGDKRLQYSLPILGYPLPILLALKALKAKTVFSRLGYSSATAATAYMLYKFACWMYAKPFSSDGILINTLLSTLCCRGMRTFFKWRKEGINADNIIKRASESYDQHEGLMLFVEFVRRLQKTHLSRLSHPYKVCELLEAPPQPFSFIDDNGRFIESLYQVDKEGADERIQLMVALLEQLIPAEELRFSGPFKERFLDHLTPKDKATLPCESLLMLAQYRPEILYKQHRFLESIAERTTEDGKPLLAILRVIAAKTKNPNYLASSDA